MSVVIIWTRFGLYIMKLKATVTLTFNELISKLIGVIYMNICTEFKEPMSILCQIIIWTRFVLYIIKLKVTVTLTFDGLISNSIGIIYTPETNVCAKFDEPRSVLCLVIIWTRFGLC